MFCGTISMTDSLIPYVPPYRIILRLSCSRVMCRVEFTRWRCKHNSRARTRPTLDKELTTNESTRE